MLADFFTKPLQGILFRKSRDVIMGYKPIDTLKVPHPHKERVGNKKNEQNNKSIEQNNKSTERKQTVTWADIVHSNK